MKIIAGGANNQLGDEEKHGKMLTAKGILYAPDYAINAGGLINVANELNGYSKERALKQAEGIYATMLEIFSIAEREGIPTWEASGRLAEDRISRIAHLRKFFAGNGGTDGRFGDHHHRT